jgi:uncharacterized protein (DUF4415 family)
MNPNIKPDSTSWIDPDDDDVVWTEEMFRRAAVYHGDKLIRPASGTLTKPGRPKSADPKKQVTLRLDSIVLEKFRAMGPRWQSRINAELRKALGL